MNYEKKTKEIKKKKNKKKIIARYDVRLYVKASYVTVFTSIEDVNKKIDSMLSYPSPKSEFIRKAKLREATAKAKAKGVAIIEDDLDVMYWTEWDGRFRFYRNFTFPVGFLWRVVNSLRLDGYTVNITDERVPPKKLAKQLRPKFTGALRDYQLEALKSTENENGGIIDMGTGAGKTIIALALISEKALRTTVIVPNTELMNDWWTKAKEFLEFDDGGFYVGYITGNQQDISLINIITINSLYNAFKKHTTNERTIKKYQLIQQAFLSSDMIIVDECHHASSKSWKEMMEISTAYYRFGFTATTDMRSDKDDMTYYGLFGEKLYTVRITDLINKNVISRVNVKFHDTGYSFAYLHKWSGIGGVEYTCIVKNGLRNKIIVDCAIDSAINENRQTLVLVRRVDHGHILLANISQKLTELGLPQGKGHDPIIQYVHGKHPHRKEIIQQFRDNELKILIAQYQLLGEGIDIPKISSIIMAMGGKSSIITIQNLGRGIRKTKGKKDLIIHDFADRGLFVEDHAIERFNTYLAEQAFNLNVKGTFLESIDR